MNSRYLAQLSVEAISVGIMLVIVMTIIQKTTLDPIFIMFISGVIVHLGCEITGLNKWYCLNGASCIN